MRLAAIRDPSLRATTPQLGKKRESTGENGWAPRSNEEAVIATAESLVRLGLV